MASLLILLVAMIMICSAAAIGVDVNACSAGRATCKTGTCKTNVWTDKHNCGACRTVCPTPKNFVASCVKGVCKKECKAGFTQCDEECVKVATHVNHCGTCGNACPAPPANGTAVCVGGTCRVNCNKGFSKCNGGCYNLNDDIMHCGSCTKTCSPPANGTASCVEKTCEALCPEGFMNCNGNCTAVDDEEHYGSCDTACDLVQNGTNLCHNDDIFASILDLIANLHATSGSFFAVTTAVIWLTTAIIASGNSCTGDQVCSNGVYN